MVGGHAGHWEGKLPGYKKAGRFPMREDVGPARNPLLKRRKNVQPNTKTQSSCAGFSSSVAKGVFETGGFTSSFAEITDGMSTEPGFPCGKLRFQKTIYIPLREKSSSGTGNLGLFSKKNEKRTLITFPTDYIEHRRTETHIRTPTGHLCQLSHHASMRNSCNWSSRRLIPAGSGQEGSG